VKAKLYKTYAFKDKDPIIDHLRTPVNGKSYSKLSADSGVSTTTLSNWFYGATKRPQFATIAAVARAIGPEGVAAIVKCVRKK
jgi:DNA-binding phage protein